MDCSNCGHSNVDSARFCGQCGSRLATTAICPACASENFGGQSFCSACGHALSDPAGAGARDPRALIPDVLAEKIRAARPAIHGERKQITVMFVDIVGSMDLAERLDPERWRGLLDRFFAITSGVVHLVEGTIDKFTGDGVMALFGAPIAHEDHARRACVAALELHAALAPFQDELAGEGLALSVRVGLNSGEVIGGEIGDEGKMDYTAIGHTVGLAQRMESLAAPNSTTLSAATAGLVAGEFELRDLGQFAIKGSSVPRAAFELLGTASGRDAAEMDGARSPFVGRDRELATLQAALESAMASEGQVVGLVGEPGVGKSRLAQEFSERCAREGAAVQRVRAVAHGREVPLLPVLDLMRTALGVEQLDEPAVARERIAERLASLEGSFAADLPLLFDFLGVPDPDRPAVKVDPEVRQRELLSIVRRFVHARAAAETVVTVIEDLHWLDEASRPFLAELVRAASGSRTLLILTYRPEYGAEILRGSHCEQLALRPLPRSAVGQLLSGLLGDDPSLDGLAEMIAARAVGNPFFCEELVAALGESGHLLGDRGAYRLGRTVEGIVLPATVQATLAARIDRLAAVEKELLQLASVIGYEVSEPLLRAIADLPDGELTDALQSLVSAELLSERIGKGGVEFAFKHPLTQEVAYRSQLGERRRSVHRQVAMAIEALSPGRSLDERAALVATHWEAAGELLLAARWNARAASWIGLSDMSQAVAHWRKVNELTDRVPDAAGGATLSRVAHVRRLDYGWRLGMPEHEATVHYERARRILEQSGDRPKLVGLTALYATLRGMAGHIPEYEALSEEAYRLSVEVGDPGLRMSTIVVGLYARFVRGRLDDSLALADEALALAADDPSLGGHESSLVSPYAYCMSHRAWILCYQGRLEESAQTLDRALRTAEEQHDIETQGWTHMYHVLLDRYRDQPESALAHGTAAYEIAERVGSAFSRVWQLYFFGYAKFLAGETTEAIAAIERSIELSRQARTGLELEPVRLATLAEALLAAGESARALDTAREGVAMARQHGNDAVLPCCYRVLADALLASGASDSAAAARDALEHAIAAVEATGARMELPLIQSTRARLAPVS